MDTTKIIIVGVIAVAVMLVFGIVMRRVDAKLHNNTQKEQKKSENNNQQKK